MYNADIYIRCDNNGGILAARTNFVRAFYEAENDQWWMEYRCLACGSSVFLSVPDGIWYETPPRAGESE